MFAAPTNVVGQATEPRLAANVQPIYLIVRSDDGGMSHRVHRALNPDLRQFALERRAQIDRAMRSRLKIDYLDYRTGTVSPYPEFRDVAERLARDVELIMYGS